MNFTEFIGQNHLDPDSLLNAKFDQLCKLSEDYAEYKQLLQSHVVMRSEQLICPNCKSKNIQIRHKSQSFMCNNCKEGWAN